MAGGRGVGFQFGQSWCRETRTLAGASAKCFGHWFQEALQINKINDDVTESCEVTKLNPSANIHTAVRNAIAEKLDSVI